MSTLQIIGAAAPWTVAPASDEALAVGAAQGFLAETKEENEVDCASGGGNCAGRQRRPPPLTDRQRRVVTKLLDGPLLREQLDAVAGASNGPQLVKSLRERFAMDFILTEFVEKRDRDGKAVKVGRYHLNPARYAEALRALASDAGAEAA